MRCTKKCSKQQSSPGFQVSKSFSLRVVPAKQGHTEAADYADYRCACAVQEQHTYRFWRRIRIVNNCSSRWLLFDSLRWSPRVQSWWLLLCWFPLPDHLDLQPNNISGLDWYVPVSLLQSLLQYLLPLYSTEASFIYESIKTTAGNIEHQSCVAPVAQSQSHLDRHRHHNQISDFRMHQSCVSLAAP